MSHFVLIDKITINGQSFQLERFVPDNNSAYRNSEFMFSVIRSGDLVIRTPLESNTKLKPKFRPFKIESIPHICDEFKPSNSIKKPSHMTCSFCNSKIKSNEDSLISLSRVDTYIFHEHCFSEFTKGLSKAVSQFEAQITSHKI